MRAFIALCSMILLFSINGVQAQTESVPAAGDSIQSPAPDVEMPIVTVSPAVKATPSLSVREMKDTNSLTGAFFISCNGMGSHTKFVGQSYSSWGGNIFIYETEYVETIVSLLVSVNYCVFEGFTIGASFGRQYQSYSEGLFTHNNKVDLLGPRLAYYYGKKDSKFLPFAAVEYDIQMSDIYDQSSVRVGAGMLFQPKPHLGISFGVDYLKSNYDYLDFSSAGDATTVMGVLGLTGIIY